MSMQPPGQAGYPPPPGPQAAYPPPPPPGPMPPPPMGGPMPQQRTSAGERPGMVMVAGIVLGGLAVMFLAGAVMEFTELIPSPPSYSSVENSNAIFLVLMGLGSIAAAVLAFANPDFGRVFAAAAAGAGIWEAAGAWRQILMFLFDGNAGIVPDEFWIRIIPPVLGGFAGILALVMLATPKVSDWSAAKRRA